MKIILAIDGSKHSNWAVDLLLNVPLAVPPEIHLLHVVDFSALTLPLLSLGMTPQYKRVIHERVAIQEKAAENFGNRLVSNVADRIRARWGAVHPCMEKGHAAETIIKQAKQEGADLIILGSRGRSHIDAFLMGSVSQKVAMYAPCSVLVVKRKGRVWKKVLLAVDGSKHSRATVKFLKAHVLQQGIRVTVLHVWDYPFPPPAFPEWLSVEDRYSQDLMQAGFKARPLFLRGHTAADTVVETANRKAVDLAVVGSRGLTGLKRYLLGGVSQKVVKYCERSILVVKGL